MNKIEKLDGKYYLICENGEKYLCSRWFEKKTNEYHILLPKDNPSGRRYIREKLYHEGFEFQSKMEHRELGSMGWRARLTDEEKDEIEKLETRIEQIKRVALSREIPKIEKDSKEWLEREIQKLQRKLAEKQI